MKRRWTGTLFLLLILAAATVVRVWRLSSIPLGLHNDEAWTGLNAREVLRDGWIGPYLYPSGCGQPAGPVYFTALLFTVERQTTFNLRLSMALIGIATIAFTYLAVREMFDRATALVSAALLVSMPWHLHLSRTAFMVGAWPCIQMAAVWAVFRARRQPGIWRYAGAGVLMGLGVYSYNAYPLSVPVVALPLLYDLVAARRPGDRRRAVISIALVAAMAMLVARSMIRYAERHDEYFSRQHSVSVFFNGDWPNSGWPARAGIIAARGSEWGRGLLFGGRSDWGDALGAPGHPLLDPLTSAAAAIGIALAIRGWRRPACGVLLAAVLVLPFGALLTIGDGLFRRTFGLAPFIAALAALPLARLWQWVGPYRAAPRIGVRLAIGLAMAAATAENLWSYFVPLQKTTEVRTVFSYQLDAAARFLKAQVPTDTPIYLYSNRWAANFESIRWYVPDHQILDRSREFRRDVPSDAAVQLDADSTKPAVFLLLGNYLDLVGDLRARYPNAEVYEQERDGEILFRAVSLRSVSP